MRDAVIDIAGAMAGGSGRWAAELDRFLPEHPCPPAVIGRGRYLTPRWLALREPAARKASMAIATNNASFAFAGKHRKVLLGNALHFAFPNEEHLVQRMPISLRAQIPVIRQLCRRADSLVVPSNAMGERVLHHLPWARSRMVIQPHPVTPVQRSPGSGEPFILVPVLPAPYKDIVAQLGQLLSLITEQKIGIRVVMTAAARELPLPLAAHPALGLTGHLPYAELEKLWQTATAILFPSTLESFGYPLAEARAAGIPVLAPASPIAEEVAGKALLPFDPVNRHSLADAVARINDPVPADAAPFEPASYFQRFLELP